MDRVNKKEVTNPRRNPSWLSTLTFAWLFDIFLLGWRRNLTLLDLSPPMEKHTSQWMGHQIISLWNEEKKIAQKSKEKKHPSLLRILRRLFGKQIMIVGVIQAVGEIITKVVQPIFLVNILRYFHTYSTMSKDEAFMWGGALLVSNVLYCFVAHISMYYMVVISMEIRIACCALIYDKIMRISKAVMESKTSAGQMINIFSSDMSRMESLLTFAHYGWISPILVLVIVCFIYMEMEIPGLLGLCVLALFIPIQGYIAKLVSRLISKHAKECDERLRLTNEIIKGVQVIKMYAWEKPFTNLVNVARKMEMKIVTMSKIAYGISLSFEHFVPRTCLFVTLVAYVLFGNQITAEKVFMVAAYYNVMRLIAFRLFAVGMNAMGEMKISIDRIQQFMNFDEIDNTTNNVNQNVMSREPNVIEEYALEFQHVTAKWTADVKDKTLDDVSFTVKSGSLVAIIGQVGSGKTSIFHTILHELPLTQGKVKVSGKISYCSQEPWIFASSIQENILFGQPLDEEKYESVISVCQLRKDFAMFPHGDKTLVGERGINLSGGQCARVNLARAVYVDADIYLLDDPLSAVDTNVGRRIFEKCIKNYLKSKTVVLVTHQYQYLKDVENLIVLSKGKVAAAGSLDKIRESGLELIQMLKVSKPNPEEKLAHMQRQKSTMSIISTITSIASEDLSYDEEPIMKDETLQVGAISKGIYLAYLKAAQSFFYVLFVFVMAVTTECFAVGGDYFVAYWIKSQEPFYGIQNGTATAEENISSAYWHISVYGGIIAVTIILVLMQSAIYFEMCRRISNNLYQNMFLNVIRATMSFFNDNTMGRIMNRFSKDVVVVDRLVSQSFRDVMISFITFVIIIILVTIVNPWLILPTLFVALLFILFRMFYVRTSRCIKRLEGITRSPVFTHLSASLQGLATIRALGAQQILKEEFDNHQNLYSAVWIISAAGDRALSFYMDILCSLLIGLVTFTILLLKDSIDASDAGLVITQCILLVGVLQWGIRQSSELETNMTSVERILEFSNLQEEPPLETVPRNKPPRDWPDEGRIEFQNVYLMYDENAALHNLNFSIASKEKIGIVGRTGAGKSSLITALFRLADIEGDIYIDGIATSTLGLHDFRSKISIIPQEPVLFVGNLRCNLDPFEEFQDNDLWQALEDVEMKTVIAAKEGLDMKVSDGGSNFSVGERQLLCLARAILRKNLILVLDEATANVDPKTDELIQQTVRRKFQDCTVLTIAHRLNTVMDSDRILVMNAGSMVEFGHPFDLLQNENGYLYDMVKQTGRLTAQALLRIAKENYPSQCTKL